MRARFRPGLLSLIPAILLSIVAAAQVRLTRTEQLTPWKGGGFGMFSTNGDASLGARPLSPRLSPDHSLQSAGTGYFSALARPRSPGSERSYR